MLTNVSDETLSVLIILQGEGPVGEKQVGGECSLLLGYI